jgi:uncharacterized membrane protein YphA (DoxX/SURF4 family)
MEAFFTRLHAAARRVGPLYRLAVISRLLLALGFLPTGMVKLLGQRFTQIGTDNAIGAFFEAMYQTGFYWNFIGAGQIVAAVLLLIPATSTLGAVMFFPIMLNITVLTWSIHFHGTIYITALMLLANLFLLCWDFDRWRFILFAPQHTTCATHVTALPPIERAGYALGTAAAFVMLLATRGFVPMKYTLGLLGICAVASLMVLSGWVQAARAPRRTSATA